MTHPGNVRGPRIVGIRDRLYAQGIIMARGGEGGGPAGEAMLAKGLASLKPTQLANVAGIIGNAAKPALQKLVAAGTSLLAKRAKKRKKAKKKFGKRYR